VAATSHHHSVVLDPDLGTAAVATLMNMAGPGATAAQAHAQLVALEAISRALAVLETGADEAKAFAVGLLANLSAAGEAEKDAVVAAFAASGQLSRHITESSMMVQLRLSKLVALLISSTAGGAGGVPGIAAAPTVGAEDDADPGGVAGAGGAPNTDAGASAAADDKVGGGSHARRLATLCRSEVPKGLAVALEGTNDHELRYSLLTTLTTFFDSNPEEAAAFDSAPHRAAGDPF
jgi:hypothetical protein